MKNRQRGSTLPAVLFALVILALVAFTVAIFLSRKFASPAPISDNAAAVNHQYLLTLWIVGAVFVLAQLSLAFAVFRFRDRGQRARFLPGSVALEVACTAAAVIIFLGLGALGKKAWAAVRYTGPPTGSIQVEVTEMQFQFLFRYPGADGKFGRLDPALINAAMGNPLGIDPNSPEGKDDIVTGTLAVPVDRPVELLLRSQDVIHGFLVRELRLQQDAVPGMIIPLHFTPNKIGKYDIVCTQLCGLGHQRMHSYLEVMSEADYEKFLKQQAAAQ
ncbi:MAG TPA: cytochrome c oxidase subunit II [Candidatus Aquilonibacter sp.]|nr:cytochrome c oxidase subunit II [Candidatus Aquilonibacter sp.]